MILAPDFLSVMSFWLPNEALTSSSHLRVGVGLLISKGSWLPNEALTSSSHLGESATDFLSAMDSDLEQSPYIVGDGFLISNEFSGCLMWL